MSTPEQQERSKGLRNVVSRVRGRIASKWQKGSYERLVLGEDFKELLDILKLVALEKLVGGLRQDELIKRKPGERWAHDAFNTLERWIINHDGEPNAALIPPLLTWMFHSYYIQPFLINASENMLDRAVDMRYGITAIQQEDGEKRINVFFPIRSSWNQSFFGEQIIKFHEDLSKKSQEWGKPIPRVYPQLVVMEQNPGENFRQDFEGLVRAKAKEEKHDFIGIYVDNLELDLKTVMHPLFYRAFVNTPIPTQDFQLSSIWDKKPKEVFGTPYDKPFRDLVVSVWIGYTDD